MFGSKITRHNIHANLRRAKNMLGGAYHHTKSILGDIDHGVRVAKTLYGAFSPVLDSLMGDKYKMMNNNVMKALSGYDGIRNTVMTGHDEIQHNVNQVTSNLKKSGVNLML